MFALKGGVSPTQSPSELILNRKLDFNAHCKVEFGEYVQTHEEHDNSMATRTVGAIATCPTGNIQGGYYFIRLDTGRRINRKDWTLLPMPPEVIDQFHRLARRAKAKKTLTFTNCNNKDLDTLYADIGNDDGDDDDDDNEPHQPDGELAGVDIASDDNKSDSDSEDVDYDPNHDDKSYESNSDNDVLDTDTPGVEEVEDTSTSGTEDVETTEVAEEEENNETVRVTETTGVEEMEDENGDENADTNDDSNNEDQNEENEENKNEEQEENEETESEEPIEPLTAQE